MQNFRRHFYFLSAGILFLILFPNFLRAQTPPQTEETPSIKEEPISPENNQAVGLPVLPDKTTAENLVHFGDLIDVDIIGSTEYDWRGKLNPEGFLNGLDFVDDPVYGLCRTEEEIASDVAKGFSRLLRKPQVKVSIIDRSGRPVSFLYGAVKTTQRFQIQRPVRLNELLILSGGITEKASGEIQILRPPNLSCVPGNIPQEESTRSEHDAKEKFVPARQNTDSQFLKIKISDLLQGKPESNPFIYSGDTITVLEAEPVYVIGGVSNPKQINATAQLTLSRAIAAAGGFSRDADPKRITVFRREKTETKLIEVNFEKLEASPEEDIVLRALDIVEVSRRGREKNKFPPIINTEENPALRNSTPPLRIID